MDLCDCEIYLPEFVDFAGCALARSLFWRRALRLAFAVLWSVRVVFGGITTPKKCGLAGTPEPLDDLRRSERSELT